MKRKLYFYLDRLILTQTDHVINGSWQNQLLDSDGHNALMTKVFETYLTLLKVGQSETAIKHIFASLRAFIIKVRSTYFFYTRNVKEPEPLENNSLLTIMRFPTQMLM